MELWIAPARPVTYLALRRSVSLRSAGTASCLLRELRVRGWAL